MIAMNTTNSLLNLLRSGNNDALGRLMERVYDDLKQRAKITLHRNPQNHTLQQENLLSELYLKLSKQTKHNYESRKKFLAYANTTFYHIIIDEVRRKSAKQKDNISIHDTQTNLNDFFGEPVFTEFDTVIKIFEQLKEINPEGHCIASLYAFSGLTMEDIAKRVNRSTKTVSRKLTLAKSWLSIELSKHHPIK